MSPRPSFSQNLLLLVTGAALGSAVTWFILAQFHRADLARIESEHRTARSTIAVLREDVAEARQTPKPIRSATDAVAAKTTVPVTTAAASPAPSAVDRDFSATAASAAASMMAQQTEAKLVGLTNRLALTPSQRQRYADFLADAQAKMVKMTERLLAGEAANSIMADQTSDTGEWQSEERLLEDILSPEQFAGYEAYGREQKQQLYETIAQSDLNTLNSMFPLSEDQKDTVFGTLYEARELKINSVGNGTSDSTITAQKQRADFLRERLAAILPPTQVDLYLEQEARAAAAQAEMIQQFLPKETPAVP